MTNEDFQPNLRVSITLPSKMVLKGITCNIFDKDGIHRAVKIDTGGLIMVNEYNIQHLKIEDWN